MHRCVLHAHYLKLGEALASAKHMATYQQNPLSNVKNKRLRFRDRLRTLFQMAQAAAADERVVVVNSDCPPQFLDIVKSEALLATTKFNTHREMAEYLKKKFDEMDGPTWNCIVGHNFSANVRHIAERFAYIYIDQLGFLLFKAQ